MKKLNLGPTDRLHEHLSGKSASYKSWHTRKIHHFVHWGVLILIVISYSLLLVSPGKDNKVQALTGGYPPSYFQESWAGGVSGETAILSQISAWTKYSSSTNLTVGDDLNRMTGSGPSELISSPINLEGKEIHFMGGSVCGTEYGGHIYGRTASTVGGLSGASWVEYTPSSGGYLHENYFQYRVSLSDPCNAAQSIGLYVSHAIIGGTVKDSGTGQVLLKYTVSGPTCDTGNFDYTGGGGMGEPGSYFIYCDYFVGETSKTVTITAPGYTAVTKNIPITQKNWSLAGMTASQMKTSTQYAGQAAFQHAVDSASYSAESSFNLQATASSGSSPTPSTGTTTGTTTSNSSKKGTAINYENLKISNTVPKPELLVILAGDKKLEGDKVQGSNFKKGQKIVFSGKAVPNGKVLLFFQSDPFEDVATADKDGNWSYELTQDLGEGEHSLQIAVTDPTTNLTSEKSAPVKFVLVAEAKAVTVQTKDPQKKPSHPLYFYLLGGFAAIILVAGGIECYLFFVKGKGFLLKRVIKKENKAQI
ncbi:MAG: Ig-like domain-containing protein [bacterium]|nr:Ig-like domain-containing protein [bacterium]